MLHYHGRESRATVAAAWILTAGSRHVPTLFRFLFVVGFIVGAVYAGMFALATFVEPQEREITVTIPNSRLGK